MHWRDQGVLLAVRRHGETAAMLEVFTESHGRHSGYLHGASSRKISTFLQPGTQLSIEWRARLHEFTGYFKIEPIHVRASEILVDRLALIALSSICALLCRSMPERDPDPVFYHRSIRLMNELPVADSWYGSYLRWELALLDVLGIGLDLGRCAVTGQQDDLGYVSSRTGRAVSRTGAGQWAARLLPLPSCFLNQDSADLLDLADGLRTTGHFMKRGLVSRRKEHPLPDARRLLVRTVERRTGLKPIAANPSAA